MHGMALYNLIDFTGRKVVNMGIKRYLSFTSIYCQQRLPLTYFNIQKYIYFFSTGYLIYIDSSFLDVTSVWFPVPLFSRHHIN